MAEDVVLLLGAGASAVSGLPTFQGLLEKVVQGIELPEETLAAAANREADLFDLIAAAGLDEHRFLGLIPDETGSGPYPNAIHRVAARILARGNSVWTGNVDELIEIAADDLAIRFHRVTPESEPNCDCDLGHLFSRTGR